MDDLEHEFMLIRIEAELEEVTDLGQLRSMCMQLVRMNEAQKQIFRAMFDADMEEHDR